MQELLLVTSEAPAPTSPSIDSETLFRLHARFVASFLYRLGLRDADIEDAVQEVFLTAHRRGGYRQGAASPTTFLAKLALEVNLARRRRASRSHPVDAADLATATLGEAPADPTQALAAKDAARRLQGALDAMTTATAPSSSCSSSKASPASPSPRACGSPSAPCSRASTKHGGRSASTSREGLGATKARQVEPAADTKRGC
jgi:sigma-70-like protein